MLNMLLKVHGFRPCPFAFVFALALPVALAAAAALVLPSGCRSIEAWGLLPEIRRMGLGLVS